MTVIDVHTHFFPDKVAASAIGKLECSSGQKAFHDGTRAGQLASMDKAGIDRALVLPVATNPEKVSSVNRFSASVGEPRLVMSGALHPLSNSWREELDEILSFGMQAVKLHPEYQEFDPDDPELLPFFAALRDAGLVVVFHAGEDISFDPPARATPECMASLLDHLPGLKILATHMGGFRLWDSVERHLAGKPVWMDTPFGLGWMPDERFRRLLSNHGSDYVMFGSDSPWLDQSEELQRFLRLDLPSPVQEKILYSNAAALFPALR